MISIFISSKNRPAQLRLLLESIQKNWLSNVFRRAEVKYHIRVTATEQLYADGYNKLFLDPVLRYLNNVSIIQNPDFIEDFYLFLNNAQEISCFFCDDCIVFRETPDPADFWEKVCDPHVWALSLRLGLNTTVLDYKTITEQAHLSTVTNVGGQIIEYPFKSYKSTENYGLPFSWDGHMYQTSKLKDFFNNTDFQCVDNLWSIPPQWIENYAMNRRDQIKQNMMLCFPQNSVICMNWNSTHRYARDSMKIDASKETLCQKYLDGEVIDLQSIDFSNIVSTHEELPFKYKKL